MNNYADFMLNELVGFAGLDFEQTAEVIHRIDTLREEDEDSEAGAGG